MTTKILVSSDITDFGPGANTYMEFVLGDCTAEYCRRDHSNRFVYLYPNQVEIPT